MLNDFESISPTAIFTAYPKIYTDIPYEKEIYKWLSNNCNDKVKLNKLLAPEIEARYKLTNRLLDKLEIKQVLEIAAGYSSRGLIYSKKGYKYVEMDLDNVSKNKMKLLKSIDETNENLHILCGNALNENDYIESEKYFEEDKEIAIINEGLLRYLTFEEKKIVGTNIYNMLKRHNNGVWITCDVTPKKFLHEQDKCIPNCNNDVSKITSRNDLKERFENVEHIKSFFGEIGFKNIEIHKFSEMKDELKSFDILGINKNKYDELLESCIVAVMKIV